MKSVMMAAMIVALSAYVAHAEYKDSPHKPLAEGAIAVTESGNLDKPGATYQLMKDISCDRTALFLGPDVTLDLNGYTVTFAEGEYEHMPNGGFDDDFKGWDTTGAPHAAVLTQKSDWPWIGKKVCKLPAGEELVSPYVKLPLADRSYYGMVAVLTDTAKVSISVEDEQGQPVRYEYKRGDQTYVNCPAEVGSKLDGGVCYAHFRLKPAGKYRLRIKAGDEDLIIDQADIRPSLDAGIAACETGWVYAGYNSVAWGGHIPALVDYLVAGSYNQIIDGIAKAKDNKKIVIRNGIVRNGFDGIHTWGILARCKGTVELENVKVVSAGINTNAVHGSRMTIRNCRFETDTPFIIERHNVINSPVALSNASGSEIANCEFIGGQGNMTVSGANGDVKIHDNLFVNRQRVTNHYSLNLTGSNGVEVYNNRFEPEIGCSINVFRSKDCDIHDNTFKVDAVDRSCEYYRGAGTVTGVRVTDYNSKKGEPRGCWGNKVRDNVFTVTGRQHKGYKDSHGRAVAIFYSSGAGENYFTNNRITVAHEDPTTEHMVTAFYIGAADYGAVIEGNTITANVPPFYIAAGYGPAGSMIIRNNTLIKAEGAPDTYKPIRLGYWKYVAKNVEFRSNKCVGSGLDIAWGSTDTGGEKHTWSVWWTLTVKAVEAAGKPLADREIVISDKDGKEAARVKTDADGTASIELAEYSAARSFGKDAAEEKTVASPYTIQLGGVKETVTLDANKTVTIKAE